MRPLARIVALGGPLATRLALAVLAGVAAAGAAIGLAATSAWLISRAAEQPPILYLMVAITAVRAFGISRGALRYAERLAAHDAAFRILGRLRSTAYARLERLAPAGLAAFHSGDLLARLVADVDGLADLWLRVLLPYGVALLASGLSVALVWWLVPPAGLVLGLTLAGVAFGVPVVASAVARRADRRISAARGELSAATIDLLAGAPELRVAGATAARIREVARIDARLAAAEARTSTGAGLAAFLAGIASGAAVWLCLAAGIVAVRSGDLAGVWLAVVAITPIAAHEVLAGLAPAAEHLPGLAAMAARVTAVLDRRDPVREPAAPARLPAGIPGIRAQGVRARYEPGAPDVLVLPDVDLEPGGRLLVTGPSGSGKSTFAAVLLRFLEASAGTVELVGTDGSVALDALAGDDVRRVVCLCAQDPHVFATSVLENVRLARPDASPGEIRDALRGAQLLAWADGLPEGLETQVGDRGARLSAGQRQRLALARALLANAGVVIFDEPTEHLDERTATALVADLLEATAGRTVVMITHRAELVGASAWSARVDLGAPMASAAVVTSPQPGSSTP